MITMIRRKTSISRATRMMITIIMIIIMIIMIIMMLLGICMHADTQVYTLIA